MYRYFQDRRYVDGSAPGSLLQQSPGKRSMDPSDIAVPKDHSSRTPPGTNVSSCVSMCFNGKVPSCTTSISRNGAKCIICVLKHSQNKVRLWFEVATGTCPYPTSNRITQDAYPVNSGKSLHGVCKKHAHRPYHPVSSPAPLPGALPTPAPRTTRRSWPPSQNRCGAGHRSCASTTSPSPCPTASPAWGDDPAPRRRHQRGL